MKIAFFNAFPMISEAFIAKGAAALIDQGHTADIALPPISWIVSTWSFR